MRKKFAERVGPLEVMAIFLERINRRIYRAIKYLNQKMVPYQIQNEIGHIPVL